MSKDRQIFILKILAEGCKIHPSYRAIRPASGKCKCCLLMWNVKLELKGLMLKTHKKELGERNNRLNPGVRPINKHGNYDGTDVGFTTGSIQSPKLAETKFKRHVNVARPINKHGNYDGTDAGFTSSLGLLPEKKD